jgi:EpsI family protein
MPKKQNKHHEFVTEQKSNNSLRLSATSLTKTALYGLLLVGLYYQSIAYMTKQWNKDEYTYCYLMPPVILFLIWQKRASLANLPSLPSWKGLIPLFIGIALFWLGELGGEYFSLYISLWLVIVGLCWIHLGWGKMKTIAFPLFMILSMFPLPNFIYNKISLKLQLISSHLGVSLLHAYGMPAYREGNIIDLAFTQLQVVEACSGLKTLISLIVLGLLLVYFYKAALWKRALLMISTVPIAILTNSTRIAITGVLYGIWGASVAEGFFHGFSGILIFMFSFCMLLLEIWILEWLPPRESKVSLMRERREKREKTSLVTDQMINLKRTSEYSAPQVSPSPSSVAVLSYKGKRDFPPLLRPPQFIVAALLLGATFILSQGIDFREKIAIKKPFDQFPVHVGEWRGTRQTMEQRFIDKLDLSSYVMLDYKNREKKEVNFYVAYYESQRKGESIHSPGTCLPGSGWVFNKAGSTTVPISGYKEGFIRVNRALMMKDGQKQISYYWFPQRGRILTNLYQLKMFTFWDALTKQRTDGALVRIITPVYDSENVAEADARLQGFTREIVPILSEFIPN